MTACTKVNIITACELNRVDQIQNYVSKQLKIEEMERVGAELIYLPSYVSLGPPACILLTGR